MESPSRIAGSWATRSASFTSSHPARRPNTDRRNRPVSKRRVFLPRRHSDSVAPARSVRPRTSSISRYANNPAREVMRVPWNSSLRRRSKSTRRDPSPASLAERDFANHSAPGYRLQATGYRLQATGYRLQAKSIALSGHWIQDRSNPSGKCGFYALILRYNIEYFYLITIYSILIISASH